MKLTNKNDVLFTACENAVVEISDTDAATLSGGIGPWGGNVLPAWKRAKAAEERREKNAPRPTSTFPGGSLI